MILLYEVIETLASGNTKAANDVCVMLAMHM